MRAENTVVVQSDLPRLDRVKDSDIDYSEIPALDESFLSAAPRPLPPAFRE